MLTVNNIARKTPWAYFLTKIMTNHYELLYLVPTSYTEEGLVPIKEKIQDLISKFEGEITREDSLGKKKLAYPIKGNHQSYYLTYEFDLDGDKLKELNKNLKLTSELLRHMIVKKKLQSPSLAKATEEKMAEVETKIARERPVKKIESEDKIKLEDLDRRLDEILKGDIL